MKALADSAMLDVNSSGTFKGREKLPGGIYFIVSPKKEILFELLIDKIQNFSIVADSIGIPDKIAFEGSEDNTLFQFYTRFMAKEGKEIEESRASLAKAKTAEDSTRLSNRIKQLNLEIQEYRILMQCRCTGRYIGYSYHIGSILHQYTCITMVRVIIIGPGCNDHIRVPLTNFFYDL